MTPTKDQIRTLYADLLAHAKDHKDSDGVGNAAEDLELIAFNGVRSMVHGELEAESPQPGPHPDDEGDPDMHHARQKLHGIKLWKRTEELVAAAGLTAKGLVS